MLIRLHYRSWEKERHSRSPGSRAPSLITNTGPLTSQSEGPLPRNGESGKCGLGSERVNARSLELGKHPLDPGSGRHPETE
jgi:hypothetical protein